MEKSANIESEIVSTKDLVASLTNEGDPIAKRTRCVFLLKHLSNKEGLLGLSKGLDSSSVLLSHEVAFAMGQMRLSEAIPILKNVLEEEKFHPILRHEAAEALGAIGASESLAILEKYRNDKQIEVSETCDIAVERIKWVNNFGINPKASDYDCTDPAPCFDINTISLNDLKNTFLDTSKSLFERYRAMFSLRDLGSEEALKILCEGFNDESPVFRHEIAYVLGQMQNPLSVQSLINVLGNASEHSMVRHEAAEALGSIGNFDCLQVLEKYLKDDDDIVRESCEVALDIIDYWKNNEA